MLLWGTVVKFETIQALMIYAKKEVEPLLLSPMRQRIKPREWEVVPTCQDRQAHTASLLTRLLRAIG